MYSPCTYTPRHWGVCPVCYFSMGSIAWEVCRVFTFASVTAKQFLHLPSLFHTLMPPSRPRPTTPHNLRPSQPVSYIFFLCLSWVSIAALFSTVPELFPWLGAGGGFEMNVKCFSGRLCSHPEHCLDRSFSQPLCVCVCEFAHLCFVTL